MPYQTKSSFNLLLHPLSCPYMGLSAHYLMVKFHGSGSEVTKTSQRGAYSPCHLYLSNS